MSGETSEPGKETPGEETAASSSSAATTVAQSLWSSVGGGTSTSDWNNFSFDSLASSISARASEALNELNSVDVKGMADALAEKASEAAKELEQRADEAFGVSSTMTTGTSGAEEIVAATSTKEDDAVDASEARAGGSVANVIKSEPASGRAPVSSPPKTKEDHPSEETKVSDETETETDGIDVKDVLKELKDVKRQLAAREEEIARRAVQRASLDAEQEDIVERAISAERKLETAEARVAELTKLNKDLKKRADAQESAELLVKEKDEFIKDVMAEGETLSKKQAEMEGVIKKLRKELKERDEQQHGMNAEIENQGASVAKMNEDLQSWQKRYNDEKARLSKELSEQKEYYLSKLAQAKEELTDIEVKASVARSDELASEVKTMREREQALQDQISDLQHSLQRSTSALERQEERFKNDLAAVEERCQAAESSHDELLRRMPESTRPLLRQIEALQLQAAENAEAWAATEKVSNARLAEAEARAEAAAEREAAALDERQAAMTDKRVAMESVDKLRAEIESLKSERDTEIEKNKTQTAKINKMHETFAEQEGRIAAIEEESRERESKIKQQLAQERGKCKQLGEGWEQERAELLENVSKLENQLKSMTKEMQALQADRSATEVKSAPAPLLIGDEAGLTLAVRDTLATLKSQLSARETELQIAQDQIKKLEQTRDSLADELVNAGRLAEGDDTSAELESRYAAALELIGERDEECDELRDRITHLRSMLDSQASRIQELEAQMS